MALKLFNQKEDEETKELLARLKREVRAATRTIEEQKEVITTLTEQIQTLHNTQKNISLVLEDNVNQLNRAATELAVFKPSMEKTILTDVNEKLEAELANATNSIYAQANGFSRAKEVFKEHLKRSKELSEEVQHLKEIIQRIDAKDFELEAYAKQLAKNDKNKLELMQKVDHLESMLAKMKRRAN